MPGSRSSASSSRSRSHSGRSSAARVAHPPHARRSWAWLGLLAGFSMVVGPSVALSQAGPEPIVIRRGGVYTGTYRSLNAQQPCITIATDEPVTLRGCVLSGTGDLIRATQGWARLTVVDCRGYGLPPTQDQEARGHFLVAEGATALRIEHNYLEQTRGISVLRWNGDGTATQTLAVRYNQARNIDSRYRNGGGTMANFVGLDKVNNLPNLEIAWNEVINEPNNSLVEDNIAIYSSGGTAQSPFRVHDNYVQGAYPFPATADKFSGTGMIIDGDPHSSQGYVEAYNNQFVSTCNSAMNIAAGHDINYHHNRLVTAAVLPDGSRLPTAYTGIAVFNGCHQANFGNIRVDSNIIGYVQWGRENPYQNRQDEGDYGLRIVTNTEHLPNPVTRQTEQAEFTRWQQKLRVQNLRVGPAPQAPARRTGKNTVVHAVR